MKKFLGSTNLIKAPTFYIYKLIQVIIVDKNKILYLQTFK